MFELFVSHQFFCSTCHGLDVIDDKLIQIRVGMSLVHDKFLSYALARWIIVIEFCDVCQNQTKQQ